VSVLAQAWGGSKFDKDLLACQLTRSDILNQWSASPPQWRLLVSSPST